MSAAAIAVKSAAAHRSIRSAAAASGSTIPRIVVGLRIQTGEQRTGLAVRRVATRWQIARAARDSKSRGKAETWAAPAIAPAAQAIDRALAPSAVARAGALIGLAPARLEVVPAQARVKTPAGVCLETVQPPAIVLAATRALVIALAMALPVPAAPTGSAAAT